MQEERFPLGLLGIKGRDDTPSLHLKSPVKYGCLGHAADNSSVLGDSLPAQQCFCASIKTPNHCVSHRIQLVGALVILLKPYLSTSLSCPASIRKNSASDLRKAST